MDPDGPRLTVVVVGVVVVVILLLEFSTRRDSIVLRLVKHLLLFVRLLRCCMSVPGVVWSLAVRVIVTVVDCCCNGCDF